MAITMRDACEYCGLDVIPGEELDHEECVERLTSRPVWWP